MWLVICTCFCFSARKNYNVEANVPATGVSDINMLATDMLVIVSILAANLPILTYYREQ